MKALVGSLICFIRYVIFKKIDAVYLLRAVVLGMFIGLYSLLECVECSKSFQREVSMEGPK